VTTLEQDQDICHNADAETLARQQVNTAESEPMQVVPNHGFDLTAIGGMDAIEAAMLQCPQIDCPVTHHFGPGIYLREVFMPAGAYVMGHAHKQENMNIMLKGKMAVIVNGEAKVIEGPYIFTGQPGRKFAYILEDTVFLNAYATDETDPEAIEDMFVDKSPAWQDAQVDAMSKQAIDAAVQKYLWGNVQ
jgi:hypothetical protein